MHRSLRGRSCPRCGSRDLQLQETRSARVFLVVCLICDHEFEVGGHSERPRGANRDGSVDWKDVHRPESRGERDDTRGKQP